MLMTMKQMKHLDPDGEETYRFNDDGTVSNEERQNLVDLDSFFVSLFGKHMITNYEDL